MANPPEPTTTGLISIAAAAIATGGAILQGVWRGRDERDKEERMRKQKEADEDRARRQKEADEEAAAISARLHRLEERMGSQDVTNARQDEAIRNIDTKLGAIDTKIDRLLQSMIERPRSSGGR